MDLVNRESNTQKLKDFIKTSPKFVDEMEFTITKKSSSLMNMILDEKTMRNCSFLISSIINILIINFFKLEIKNNQYSISQEVFNGYPIFTYLGIVHLISSALLLSSWMRQTGPLVVMDKWREVCSDLKKKLKYDLKTKKKKKSMIQNILSKNVIEQSVANKLQVLQYIDSLDGIENTFTFYRIRLLFFRIRCLTQCYELKYLLVYFWTSLVALIYTFVPIYCVFLVDITVSSPLYNLI